jgi:hypothetical protein
MRSCTRMTEADFTLWLGAVSALPETVRHTGRKRQQWTSRQHDRQATRPARDAQCCRYCRASSRTPCMIMPGVPNRLWPGKT